MFIRIILSCSCTHGRQTLSFFSALFSILCCRSLSYSLNLEKMVLCIIFFSRPENYSCGNSSFLYIQPADLHYREPPPGICWMASPHCSIRGAPRHTAAIAGARRARQRCKYVWLLEPPGRIVSFVNQMAANSDSINTGCKTEEGSVVQVGFARSTLLFLAVQMDVLLPAKT